MRIKLDLASKKAMLHMPKLVHADQIVTLEIVDSRDANARTTLELTQDLLVMLITVLIDADKAIDVARESGNTGMSLKDILCDTHPRGEELARTANQHHLIDGNDPAQTYGIDRTILELQPADANAALDNFPYQELSKAFEQSLADILHRRLEADDLAADFEPEQDEDEHDLVDFERCDTCPCAGCAPAVCGHCSCHSNKTKRTIN